jgi:very-short-patch-repair endonuclease
VVNLVHARKSVRNIQASRFQKAARRILKERFPCLDIYEDFFVDGMYIDFFIPAMMLAIEVDGSQHDDYNEFFHKDGAGFAKHIRRDERKALFCQLNEITLVHVPAEAALDEQRLMEMIQNELEC